MSNDVFINDTKRKLRDLHYRICDLTERIEKLEEK